VDLSWSESSDGGTTWSGRKRLRSAGTSVSQRINDGASVVWAGSQTRVVLFDGWAANYIAYGLFLKTGTGT
jgi:hypothetical protein